MIRRSRHRAVVLEQRLALELGRTEAALAKLARGARPIVVGPFVGEIGFELLYWIPFVRWAAESHPRLRGRMTVVSRGGTRSWYGALAADYLDLLDHYSPEELLARSGMKQREIDSFDGDVLDLVAERHGERIADVLHPSLLYDLYYRLTKLDEGVFARAVHNWAGRLEGVAAIYEPFATPPVQEALAELPEEYVAVRFYFRPSFPDTVRNRAFASEIIRGIADRLPVVLLNNRMELDDHKEFVEAGSVTTIDHLMLPSTNLGIQTAVIAGARAYVGTYGGLAYLAPHLRVPSLSFASVPEHAHAWHGDLAAAIFNQPGFGSLVSLRPQDVDLLRLVVGGEVRAAATTSPSGSHSPRPRP